MCNLVFDTDANGISTATRFLLDTLTSSFERQNKILTLGSEETGVTIDFDLKDGNIGFKKDGKFLLVGEAAFTGCGSTPMFEKFIGFVLDYTKFELNRAGGGIGISDLRDGDGIIVKHKFNLDTCPVLVNCNLNDPGKLKFQYFCNTECGTVNPSNSGYSQSETCKPHRS